MATYKANVALDEGQDKILKAVAASQGKSAQDIIDSLGSRIVEQIDQWIKDRVRTKLDKLSPADQLARLSYFDNE